MTTTTNTNRDSTDSYPDIWFKDINSRVYVNGDHSPSQRGYWIRVVIESETSRSWVDAWGKKIPKKPVDISPYAYSEKEMLEKVYVDENAYEISELVRGQKYPELIKIAEVLKYAPEATQ